MNRPSGDSAGTLGSCQSSDFSVRTVPSAVETQAIVLLLPSRMKFTSTDVPSGAHAPTNKYGYEVPSGVGFAPAWLADTLT